MRKLVGYRRFISGKGRDCCVASVLVDATERDKNAGQVGQKTEDVFIPSDQLDLLKPSDIGKELVCDYDLSNGRAFLIHVSVK